MDNSVSNADKANVHELLASRPRLREELRIEYEMFSGRPCFRIDDPLNGRTHRIGADEYRFISLFTGQTAVQDAIAESATALGPDAFDDAEALAICRWLVENDLVITEANQPQAQSNIRRVQRRATNFASRLNPFFIRIPLANPDRLLERIEPWFGFLIGRAALGAWLIIVCSAIYQFGSQLDRLRLDSHGILAPSNWLSLIVCWIVLKVVHELFHGITCKKYGGSVVEAGIAFILFTPVAYVDASGAWRAPTKWQRMIISGAGIYADLFVAAVAALIWSGNVSPLISQIAYNVIIMAGLGTLLFNGNPLMRFDAYFILSDFIEIPNLYARGQQYWMQLAKKYWLGIDVNAHTGVSGMKSRFVKLYGLACFLWRVFVMISLIIAAHALFHGAGIVIAAVGVISWFAMPLGKFAKYMFKGSAFERPNLKRFAVVTLAVSSSATFLLTLVPWPGVVQAPGLVRATQHRKVRAPVSGFVSSVSVGENETLKAGQIVARLTNDELTVEYRELKLELRQSHIHLDRLRDDGDLAAVQVQQRYIEALQKRIAEKALLVDQLTVRAPIDGRVFNRHLDQLEGRYVKAGDELVTIVGRQREIRLSIDQDDVSAFASRVGMPVSVYLRGGPGTRLVGRLTEVRPHADSRITEEALSAFAGGPLAVQPVSTDILNNENSDSRGNSYRYITPRVAARVAIDNDMEIPLHLGRIALVQFRPVNQSVGQHLALAIRRWFRRRIESAQQPGQIARR